MKTAAIICEYNPLHNGHVWHIERTREEFGCDAVICIISGHFVQRGEPAFIDKWSRANTAVQCGADLAIELPSPYALLSAEGFAQSGAYIADACGVVDVLSFGSESGDIDIIKSCAAALDDAGLAERIRAIMKSGVSFAAARQSALAEKNPACASLLDSPNNILAVEYVRALNRLNSRIVPVTVKRTAVRHDSHTSAGGFASSSMIRRMLSDGRYGEAASLMPRAACELCLDSLKRSAFNPMIFERIALNSLRAMDTSAQALPPDISEGIENRIIKNAAVSRSLAQFYELTRSRRYPLSRIRRIAMNTVLGYRASLTSAPPPYIRMLAMNGTGRLLMRQIKEKASLPVIVKPAHINKAGSRAIDVFRAENRASSLLSLCGDEAGCGSLDYTTDPVVLE